MPNPFSSLQGLEIELVSGSAVTDPRNDFDLLTEEDILEKFDGTYIYANPLTGEPDYNLIGLPKTKTSLEFGGYTNLIPDTRFMRLLDAYQAKNSMFPFR